MDEKDADEPSWRTGPSARSKEYPPPAEPDRDHIAGQLDQARRGIEGVSAEGAHARGSSR